MAEPKSASGSADSYIGSFISLTSKSEIRYEGVLFSINTEESSIGLQNVRSFGTEGRKKDGPQIPPGDKIYEFILFRGSDIKDLQVKSSPPVNAVLQMQHDPAIIQSHYSRATPVSTGLASTASGSVTDADSYGERSTLPPPSLQGSLPQYQTGTILGPWVSAPAHLNVPMYWQGYYGLSNGLPHVQQQPVPFQPSPGLMASYSLQQHLPNPDAHASFLTKLPTMSDVTSSLPLPILPITSSSLPCTIAPLQISTSLSTDLSPVLSSKASLSSPPTSTLTSNLLTISSSLSPLQEVNVMVTPISSKPRAACLSTLPAQSVSQSASSMAVSSTSSILSDTAPALPDPILQVGVPLPSTARMLYAEQRDIQSVVPPSLDPSSLISPPQNQAPLLPLPIPRNKQIQRSANEFTEEFDFIAMNDKFKKDEVWGHLGKAKVREKVEDEVEHNPDDGDAGPCGHYCSSAAVTVSSLQPVYIKDEFFDSLSSNIASRGMWNGRTRYSERMKLDTETFGDFNQKAHLGHGGRGVGHRWDSRGPSYRGRGYGYGGWGRGG
ncbi:protein decapping 5 isoform X1 [Amborella trichopoda]|uniref:protein decapping 5 isoform X1 n=1 Tax=Amborella trichopoda TaxID=13333 RepID=UPI0009BC8A08|nr:protein decapping 5 isoform X1 [Amborella trichopoda]|eukprot:XP_020523618.1 protein decapping 5 isoform X1 [Amborella trichopoda]